MSRSSIFLLAAFLLVASSSASAPTPAPAPAPASQSMQELCKGSPDADYCMQFVKQFVSQPSELKSEKWRKEFTVYASMAAETGDKWVVERSNDAKGQKNTADMKTCLDIFHDNVKLAKAGKYDEAANKMDDCFISLRHHYHKGDVIQLDVAGVMTGAERLAKFYRTASYLIKKATKA